MNQSLYNYRSDTKQKKRLKCGPGTKQCGNACIGINEKCHIGTSSGKKADPDSIKKLINDPRVRTVLKTVATGKTSITDIAEALGVPNPKASEIVDFILARFGIGGGIRNLAAGAVGVIKKVLGIRSDSRWEGNSGYYNSFLITFLSTTSGKAVKNDAFDSEEYFKKALQLILSGDDFYGEQIRILKLEIANNGVFSGTFKDVETNRVFEFEVDGDDVSYQPLLSSRRNDSLANSKGSQVTQKQLEEWLERWKLASTGYLQLNFPEERMDARGKRSRKKPKCGGTSYGCGNGCITVNHRCHVKRGEGDRKKRQSKNAELSYERLEKLQQLAKDYKAGKVGSRFARSEERARDIARRRGEKFPRARKGVERSPLPDVSKIEQKNLQARNERMRQTITGPSKQREELRKRIERENAESTIEKPLAPFHHLVKDDWKYQILNTSSKGFKQGKVKILTTKGEQTRNALLTESKKFGIETDSLVPSITEVETGRLLGKVKDLTTAKKFVNFLEHNNFDVSSQKDLEVLASMLTKNAYEEHRLNINRNDIDKHYKSKNAEEIREKRRRESENNAHTIEKTQESEKLRIEKILAEKQRQKEEILKREQEKQIEDKMRLEQQKKDYPAEIFPSARKKILESINPENYRNEIATLEEKIAHHEQAIKTYGGRKYGKYYGALSLREEKITRNKTEALKQELKSIEKWANEDFNDTLPSASNREFLNFKRNLEKYQKVFEDTGESSQSWEIAKQKEIDTFRQDLRKAHQEIRNGAKQSPLPDVARAIDDPDTFEAYLKNMPQSKPVVKSITFNREPRLNNTLPYYNKNVKVVGSYGFYKESRKSYDFVANKATEKNKRYKIVALENNSFIENIHSVTNETEAELLVNLLANQNTAGLNRADVEQKAKEAFEGYILKKRSKKAEERKSLENQYKKEQKSVNRKKGKLTKQIEDTKKMLAVVREKEKTAVNSAKTEAFMQSIKLEDSLIKYEEELDNLNGRLEVIESFIDKY